MWTEEELKIIEEFNRGCDDGGFSLRMNNSDIMTRPRKQLDLYFSTLEKIPYETGMGIAVRYVMRAFALRGDHMVEEVFYGLEGFKEFAELT